MPAKETGKLLALVRKSRTTAGSREPAWHRRARQRRSSSRTLLRSFVHAPSHTVVAKVRRAIHRLESHHSVPRYLAARRFLAQLGMSGWSQGWKSGSYWGTPRRNPKTKGNRPKSPKPQKPEKPKDVLPGYDSEKWLPSAQSSSSQSGASEVPQNIVELTKILRTVVEAGKIELPKEAMALLSNQAEAEVKTEMQKEQKILNAKRKLMAKIGRLKDAMENKKVKFRTYKAAIKEQLAKESERFEKDLESIQEAIKKSEEALDGLEKGEFLDNKGPLEQAMEVNDIFEIDEAQDKAKLHAQLATSEKEKKEMEDKYAVLQAQMSSMQMQYQSLTQAFSAPLGTGRHPLQISPVPSEELATAHSPQMPAAVGVGPFQRALQPRTRDGPYTEKKLPCGAESLSRME